MESAAEKQVFKCENIIASVRGITESDGAKVVIFVAVDEIEKVTLKFGRPEHRPVLSLSIGTILVFIGLLGLLEIFWATRGWRYDIGMMLLAVTMQ